MSTSTICVIVGGTKNSLRSQFQEKCYGAKNEENDLIEVVAKYRNKLNKKAETKAKKAAEKLKKRRANIQY